MFHYRRRVREGKNMLLVDESEQEKMSGRLQAAGMSRFFFVFGAMMDPTVAPRESTARLEAKC